MDFPSLWKQANKRTNYLVMIIRKLLVGINQCHDEDDTDLPKTIEKTWPELALDGHELICFENIFHPALLVTE